MAWDLKMDTTGDLLFGPHRDLQGVTGPELDKQRIMVRMKIPRGSFKYDYEGTLGSNLHLVSRFPGGASLEEVKGFVGEALDEMEAIEVQEINVDYDDNGVDIVVDVRFKQTGALSIADDVEFDDAFDLALVETSIRVTSGA